jgi:hypothetical protein
MWLILGRLGDRARPWTSRARHREWPSEQLTRCLVTRRLVLEVLEVLESRTSNVEKTAF